jgi:hypothetical protein
MPWIEPSTASFRSASGPRRTRRVARPGAEPAGYEAVIKVVSWGKSSRAAMATAQYITRTRHKDAPEAVLSARTTLRGRPHA